jgi:plasmid stabilization system protein ParE
MLRELADHYAQLAMTKGWTEYTRHRVKELRDSSDMWAELPRMVRERIDGHKNAERERIAQSGGPSNGDIR